MNIQNTIWPRAFFSNRLLMVVRNLVVIAITLVFSLPVVSRGNDFFPIGIFSVGAENLDAVKSAGFNTAHTYLTDHILLQKYIDLADKTGIKVLIYPSDRADKGNIDREKVKRFVEKNRQSNKIIAWYIADEPDLTGGSPEQIMAVHAYLKQLDPSRPTAIVILRSDRYGQYKDASDVLMLDRYPVPKTPLNHIAEATRWAVKKKDGSGPVWAVIQAFGYQNPQLKGYGLREPTYEEMRAMTFLSIIYGAKGIFYFTFTGSEYQIVKSPQHWDDLKRIVAELNNLYPLLLMPVTPHFNAPGWPDRGQVTIDVIEGPQRDDRGLLPVHIAGINLDKDSGAYKAGRYFIAANAANANVKAKFTVEGLSQNGYSIVRVGTEKDQIESAAGAFADSFQPYEIHVYKLAKSTATYR